MIDTTIALTSIGGIDASSAESPAVFSIDSVPAGPAGNVLVEGTVERGGKLVTCTLTRPGWAQTLFVMATEDGDWSARFDHLPPGTYLLSCCAEDEGRVCAEFQVADYESETLNPCLTVDTPIQTSPTVKPKGSVTIRGNSVCCALTSVRSGASVMKGATTTDYSWVVDFGTMPSGTYTFTAVAPMEPSTGTSVTVP
jgi:hypothetical protein